MGTVHGKFSKVLDSTIPIDQSIYEASTSQKARLGTRLELGGRVFHYAQLSSSANITGAGVLLCATTPIASHQTAILNVLAATTGATSITCTASVGNEFTANQYQDGYIIPATTAGGGYSFRVKSHGSGASVAFTLYDALDTAVGAGPASLEPNPYKSVLKGNSPSDMGVGVSQCAITTGQYAWLQTWGPGAVNASTALGAGLTLCAGVSGGVAGHTVIATMTVGGAMLAQGRGVTVESNASPVFIKMNP